MFSSTSNRDLDNYRESCAWVKTLLLDICTPGTRSTGCAEGNRATSLLPSSSSAFDVMTVLNPQAGGC